jgi:hypothetical protein
MTDIKFYRKTASRRAVIIPIMRTIAIFLLSLVAASADADHHLRKGTPKDCYLYSWGKGPRWVAKIPDEFRLSLLQQKMPCVDDQYSEPTAEALTWVEKESDLMVDLITKVAGRRIIQVTRPEEGHFGKTIGTILLAMEAAPDSGWFAPFFVAQPELYQGRMIRNEHAFGYIATLRWSGTGAFREHHFFDFETSHPSLTATLNVGAIRMNDYNTEEEYQKALEIYDREAAFLAGVIPGHKSVLPPDGER